MQAIYDFFIRSGKSLGIWDFFRNAGAWWTFIIFIVGGVVLHGLALGVLSLTLKIPNKLARALIFLLFLAITVFGSVILVHLGIATVTRLGGLF